MKGVNEQDGLVKGVREQDGLVKGVGGESGSALQTHRSVSAEPTRDQQRIGAHEIAA